MLRSGRRFDLVLSDVMMPRLDGLGLLAAIRADEDLRRLPVLLLSARAGAEASVEALDSGADDYIVKPFTAPELLARVRSNLELARSRNRETALHREHAARMEELYEREHRVAEALQRSLLPRALPSEPYLSSRGALPRRPRTSRWSAATGTTRSSLGDGSLVLAIGDVAGHGLRAAAAMGQLRSATRGYALRGDEPGAARGIAQRPRALARRLGRWRPARCCASTRRGAASRWRPQGTRRGTRRSRRDAGRAERQGAAAGRHARRDVVDHDRRDRGRQRPRALHRRADRAARRGSGRGVRAAAGRAAPPWGRHA